MSNIVRDVACVQHARTYVLGAWPIIGCPWRIVAVYIELHSIVI
jgi:hypothetical protein